MIVKINFLNTRLQKPPPPQNASLSIRNPKHDVVRLSFCSSSTQLKRTNLFSDVRNVVTLIHAYSNISWSDNKCCTSELGASIVSRNGGGSFSPANPGRVICIEAQDRPGAWLSKKVVSATELRIGNWDEHEPDRLRRENSPNA